jgi:multicomponent Na+:H+ antiporter subunit G
MIGRAAYFIGVPLWKGTMVDELQDRYDRRTHTLTSGPTSERRIPDLPDS